MVVDDGEWEVLWPEKSMNSGWWWSENVMRSESKDRPAYGVAIYE